MQICFLYLTLFAFLFASPTQERDSDTLLKDLIGEQNKSIAKAKQRSTYQLEVWAVDPDDAGEDVEQKGGTLIRRKLFKYSGDRFLVHDFGSDLTEGGGDDVLFLWGNDAVAKFYQTENGKWYVQSLADPQNAKTHSWVEQKVTEAEQPWVFRQVSATIFAVEQLVADYSEVRVTSNNDMLRIEYSKKKEGVNPSNPIERGTVDVQPNGDIVTSEFEFSREGQAASWTGYVKCTDDYKRFYQVGLFKGARSKNVAQQIVVKRLDTAPNSAEFELEHYGFSSQNRLGFGEEVPPGFLLEDCSC